MVSSGHCSRYNHLSMSSTTDFNLPLGPTTANDAVNQQLDSLNLCSYNLHRFNQGIPVLRFLCDRPSPPQCILIQESWLTPSNLHKINNFSPLYSSFGQSSMNSAVSNGILRGRPFGGTHILILSDLCKFVSYVKCSDRYVVLVYKNIVILNVYLPSVVNEEDGCRLIDLLASIQNDLEEAVSTVVNPTVIVGGDFNLDFDSKSRSSILLNEFRRRWSLSLCNKLLKGNLDYSYYHE